MVALAKSRQHAKRSSQKTRFKTPQREETKEIPVIGSSCTWRENELDHFGVEVKRDVDVWEMIPEKFFDFEHLEEYAECRLPSWKTLMIGKKELCALSEKDVENPNLINRIRNNSRSSFDALRKIIQTQSDLR